MVVDDVVFIIDKPITIDSLERGDHPSLLSSFFSISFKCRMCFMTDRAACTSPTKKKKNRLRSCPGSSSSSVIRENEKEQKVNKIPPFSFSFFLFQGAPFFPYCCWIAWNQTRDDEILVRKKSLLNARLPRHNAFRGPLLLMNSWKLLMCVSQSAVNDTTSRAQPHGPNCFRIFY